MKESSLSQIDNLIRKEFTVVNAYTGTEAIKDNLIKHQAIVVHDERETPIGILTAIDILRRPHNLVIDCLTPKTNISSELTITQVMEIMQNEKEEVLPVFNSDELVGLIFKDDIVEHIRYEKHLLESQITNAEELLKQISWIQSHKMRQPVASILGLIQLIDESTLTGENIEIINMLRKTISDFDKIINSIVVSANSGINHSSR